MTQSHLKSTLALAAIVALPTLSWAGTTTKAAAPTPVEKINSSAITGDIGVSVYSAMYSRGQILFNQNPTILPYIDLFGTAYEGDGFLNKAVLSLNITEYYGHKKVPGSGSNSSWYENDFIPGIALTFGKVTISESIHWYTSPNNTAGSTTFQGLNSSISYDDSDLLGALALHPSFTYMQKINGHGGYYEVSGGPGFSSGPVSLAFPLAVGFGEDGFYGAEAGKAPKNGFAYFSVGSKVTYTLPMPKTYGTWALSAGVTYYAKDTKVTEQASFVANGSPTTLKNNDIVGTAGLQLNF
ncbi:MAG: hypothetical protein WCL08_06745 [Verrucomicrobiota bacterium]